MTKEVKLTYDKIASSWSKKVWAKSIDFNSRITAFADIKEDKRTLDVGIGCGDVDGFLKLRNVTGVDISRKMLNVCKEKHPGFSLFEGSAEALPFRNESFEFVFCRNLLQNFNNQIKAFSELYRVLEKGGKIMVIESAVYENERQYVTGIVRVAEPHHPLFPSHEQLLGLFNHFGIKKVEQRVECLHKKWLSGFCESKQATKEQKDKIISVCENLPEWYKKKYDMTIYKPEEEIESTLTFCFIKGVK